MDTTETQAALEGLARKLAALDLTDAEDSVLATIVERAAAADPEVEGFGLLTDDGTIVVFKEPQVENIGPKLARGLGLDPKNVWTDMRPLS